MRFATIVLLVCSWVQLVSGMESSEITVREGLQQLPPEILEKHVGPCIDALAKKDEAFRDLRHHVLETILHEIVPVTDTDTLSHDSNATYKFSSANKRCAWVLSNTIDIYDTTYFPWHLIDSIPCTSGEKLISLTDTGRLFFGLPNDVIQMHDVSTGQRGMPMSVPNYTMLWSSSNGDYCALFVNDFLEIRNTTSGERVAFLPILIKPVKVLFSSDGKHLLICFKENNEFTVWQMTHWQQAFQGNASGVGFSPSGRKFLVIHEEQIVIYDTSSWRSINTLPVKKSFEALFSHDETHLFIKQHANQAIMYDLISDCTGSTPLNFYQVPDSNKFLWGNKLILIPDAITGSCLYVWDVDADKVLTCPLKGTNCAFNLAQLLGTQLIGKGRFFDSKITSWDFALFKKAFDYFNTLTYNQKIMLYAIAQARKNGKLLQLDGHNQDMYAALATGDETFDTEFRKILDPLLSFQNV